MSTASYSATLRTKKPTSTSNFKTGIACQEFYDPSYNLVGIISFTGMNLVNKVITGIELTVTANKAGFGAGHSKSVYLKESNYQDITVAATGAQFAGDELGIFDGSFYGNTTSYSMSGTLLSNMASYIAAGNNTFVVYNPNATASYEGYSYNYFQWTDVSITVTYQEGVSTPSTSKDTVNMGTAVTVYTNRLNTAATHTLVYSFGNATGTISSNVGDSCSWTPPVSLAAQIPQATSGVCLITCYTYYSGALTGTASCAINLTVPASVVPTVGLSFSEATANIATQFGCYVRTASTLQVTITANGAQGSSITSYRTTVNGATYSARAFTTGVLYTAGSNTISTTVTDSRGRTATATSTFTVVDYNPPSLTQFKAERCNDAGTAPQTDSTKVRINAAGSVSPVNSKNTVTCTVYYKLTTASAWTTAKSLSATNYQISAVDQLLTQTFGTLSSYDLKIRLQDYFTAVEQMVTIGTKQVLMDFLHSGNGIAFGKVAETAERVEFGWPVILSSALGIQYGGTGATNATQAIYNLGGVVRTGDTMTGNLSIATALYPSVYLTPTYNSTTNRTVFEGSYVGASSFSSWEDATGNNRRMVEVRTKQYENSLDNAVVLRCVENGYWSQFRMFHEGMATPVPVSCGGTGANNAATARAVLGTNDASNLTTGTVSTARLPFKVAYGYASISSSNDAFVDYSWVGFTYIPYVFASYSTNGGNWSGNNGAIKIHNKTNTYCWIIVGGSYTTARAVDWFAIGT